MSTAPLLTSDSYGRLVAGLRGRTIVAVDYFVLMVGDEGTDPDEWDYGAWHEPTMGVELTMDDGGTYSAVWGSTFDYYGVELYSAPMRDSLSRVGEPGGSARVAVAEHPSGPGSSPPRSSRAAFSGAARSTALRLRCRKPSTCGPPPVRCGSPLAARPLTSLTGRGRSTCAPTMCSSSLTRMSPSAPDSESDQRPRRRAHGPTASSVLSGRSLGTVVAVAHPEPHGVGAVCLDVLDQR